MPGILMSSRTTSGLSSVARRRASVPLQASPQTTQSGCCDRIPATAVRIGLKSSAIKILIPSVYPLISDCGANRTQVLVGRTRNRHRKRYQNGGSGGTGFDTGKIERCVDLLEKAQRVAMSHLETLAIF